MDVMVERAAGLDVHQRSVVATALLGPPGRRPQRERRTFGTMRRDLEALAGWLAGLGVTDVAMEATGVYWMPVHAALEGRFRLVVANPHHIKAVPGRKTDQSDADWQADLLRHGLVRGSFVPEATQRDLRVLTRERSVLVQSLARERNLVLKLLESADVKLASVLSDVFGVSGTAMLRALVAGRLDPAAMAELAKGALRKRKGEIEAALEARLSEEHRLALRLHVEHLELLERQVAELEAAIARRLEPRAAVLERLCTVPGVEHTIAAVILAEIGAEVSAFADPRRLSAWAGLCPGNNQSGGRAKHCRLRKSLPRTRSGGNIHLKTALVQAAMAATHCNGSYLQAKYRRLRPRLGAKRALLAVAHKILIAIHAMLAKGVPYKDLGAAHLDRLSTTRTVKSLVQRLKKLGFDVTLNQQQEAPA